MFAEGLEEAHGRVRDVETIRRVVEEGSEGQMPERKGSSSLSGVRAESGNGNCLWDRDLCSLSPRQFHLFERGPSPG